MRKSIHQLEQCVREFVFCNIRMILLCTTPLAVLADSGGVAPVRHNELVVSPKRCVALHQGQTCYQRATFKWQAVSTGSYCFYKVGQSKPLKCWRDMDHGVFDMDFQAAETQQFQLRREETDEVLAAAELTVAWVYENKKRRRASWRLF